MTKISLEQLLIERNIPHQKAGQHHHAREGWIQLDCPLCSPGEKRFRLGYNKKGAYFSCWSCGPKNTQRTIERILNCDGWQAKAIVKSLGKEYTKKETTNGKFSIPFGVEDFQEVHRVYLRNRRFDPDKLQTLWDIGATSNNAGRHNWRIIIPIMLNGVYVSWTSRGIVDEGTRYITANKEEESVFHKNVLYGEDYCRTDTIVVHEGPFDVWRTGPGATCTFGTSFSLAQVKRIAKYPKRCVCFDSTPEGQIAAKKLIDRLAVFPGETYNVVLDTKDMGEASDKVRNKLRRRFLWQLDD